MMQSDWLFGLDEVLRAKAARLLEEFSKLDLLVVAFSGGVDSSLLCALGHQALGDRFLAVTVRSDVDVPGDCEAAELLAQNVGFQHLVVDFDDLANPKFVENSPERCYHCKLSRFQNILEITADLAVERGASQVWVAEGSNADDKMDYRPGARAVAELGIHSPLADAGLTKSEIRKLAQALELLVWNRPSSPCLATRFPYGHPVTRHGLGQIAAGEEFLHEIGFHPVRVRHYGQTARLEVDPAHLEDLIAKREDVLIFFKHIGFTYVVVDMAGYRMGSMNEGLKR